MLNHAVSFQHRLILAVACLAALGTGCLNPSADEDPYRTRDAAHLEDVGYALDTGRPSWEDAGSADTGSADATSDLGSQPRDSGGLADLGGISDAADTPDPAPNPTDDAGGAADVGVDAEPSPQPNPVSDAGGGADTGAADDVGAPGDTGATADAGATSDAGTMPDATPQPQPPSTNVPNFLNRSDTRALWLWADADTSRAFLDNQWGMQDALMQLAAAPHGQSARSLNRLFFEARTYSRVDIYTRLRPITYDPLLTAGEQAKLRAFNKRAHAQGLDVEYLDGQAIWLASDANAQWPKQVCRDVVTFNNTTTDVAERLDGIHFDIEPHTVQGGPYGGMWWQNKLPDGYNADWTQRFKDIMNSCRATLDAYEAQTGHHMTLTVDLGADYAFYNKPLLNFFNGPNSPVDYVTLMNYYDNRPNQNGQPSFFNGWHDGFAVTGGVNQNLNLWNNVPVLFGMETGPTGIAADYMSFYQEGYVTMYSVVDTLTQNHSGPGMLGVAFHPWGSFKDLQP